MLLLSIAVLVLGLTPTVAAYCTPGDPSCWPTEEEVAAFSEALTAGAPKRLLRYQEGGPRVSAVPILSVGDQPLYGLGMFPMQGLYYRGAGHNVSCLWDGSQATRFCMARVVNSPPPGSEPAFVVFALTATHIQLSLRFAASHRLCVSVAGTGHDFLGRHSCSRGGGLLIRTTLIKDYELDLEDRKRLGSPNVRFGAGTTFSEAHKIMSDTGYVVASGYSPSVGLAGWTLGGGHGPLVPWLGLGVDRLLEATVVTASGEVVTANSRQHSDLFWALRGGGGGNWGIVTHFTVKATRNPPEGFAVVIYDIKGDLCHPEVLRGRLRRWRELSLRLPAEVGALTFLTGKKDPKVAGCTGHTFELFLMYTSAKGVPHEVLEAWPDDKGAVATYKTWWEYAIASHLEHIVPVFTLPNGIPSVLVSREKVHDMSLEKYLFNEVVACGSNPEKCGAIQCFQSITGNLGSPQVSGVSISPAFRTAMIHLVTMSGPPAELGTAAYFSESAMNIPSPEQWYWGVNYDRLSQVKARYDPTGVFTCHNCVKPPKPPTP